MDPEKNQCSMANIKFIFLVLSFVISTIIVLAIIFTGSNQFGTKASLFKAVFIYFIPACIELLTLEFLKRRRVLSFSTLSSSLSTTPGPLLPCVEYD